MFLRPLLVLYRVMRQRLRLYFSCMFERFCSMNAVVHAQMLQQTSESSKQADRFIKAARFNDIKTIQSMVEAGMDPNLAEHEER